MIEVTILRDKYAKGWPRHEQGERAYVLALGRALERSYTSDAHFAAYRTPNERRLTSEAIGVIESVAMTCIVFDVDCQETHGSSEPAPELWRKELREKLWSLSEDHPLPYYYETRGGARILYTLAEPFLLRTLDDAVSWRQDYAIAVAHLARRYGIDADPACADWQRLYRLPRATRTLAGPPEKWPTIGNAKQIGTLVIDATKTDMVAAQARSKAFVARRTLTFLPSSGGGDGLLYHLLRAQGALVREHGREAFVIRCPFEREHSTGTTGDGSTLLYLPAAGHSIGAIHCLHGHCSGRTLRDWLGAYSEAEITEARRRAGIRAA